MYAWEAIQKALDHIEGNLCEELVTEELAEAAALSPFYFQRLFTRLVRKPVQEYIKLRRLARASEELKSREARIVDVAMDCGFGSHQTFTKSFKEAYGLTPEQYRSDPVVLVQFGKPNLMLQYVVAAEGVPLISDGIVLEFNRQRIQKPVPFMGVTGQILMDGYVLTGDGTGVDTLGAVWGRFDEIEALIPQKTGVRNLDVSYASGAPEGHFTFFAGAEVEPGAKDDRFATWWLPEREYMVCGFSAENFDLLVTDAVYKAWKYAGFWLDQHGMCMDQSACSAEMYYPENTDGAYMELWLAVADQPETDKECRT